MTIKDSQLNKETPLQSPIYSRWLPIASFIFLSACTDTVIREVPSGTTSTTPTADGANPTLSASAAGSNMVPVTESTPQLITVGGNGTTTSGSGSATGIQLQDANITTTTGTPGNTTDCVRQVPCEWQSADSQFSLTVTNTDNIATRSRLAINYSISTLHDTKVVVSQAGDAIDVTGQTYKPADQVLGTSNGISPQGIAAGESVTGTLNFDKGAESDTLSSWSIAILDGGQLRNASFTNLPVGTVTTEQADCQLTLPCVWTTPQQDVAITLESVGGLSQNSRLNANFSVVTATNTNVAVDAGSTGAGSDGTVFEGRTHAIGFDTNYQKITSPITAGIPLYGSINFYRTAETPDSLRALALVIYRDDPVPRWNPQFINVPIQ